MIYLDNSATTRPFDGVIDVMDRCMREQYFNASAAYKPAVDVDRAMRECRKTIAAQLGIQESGVIFTGGGTESDNLAILGTAARSASARISFAAPSSTRRWQKPSGAWSRWGTRCACCRLTRAAWSIWPPARR